MCHDFHTHPLITIPQKTCIAQLVPFKSSVSRTENQCQGDGCFRSTRLPQVHWTAILSDKHPEMLCTLCFPGATPSQIQFCGLIDMGTEITILSFSVASTGASGSCGVFCCRTGWNNAMFRKPAACANHKRRGTVSYGLALCHSSYCQTLAVGCTSS